MPRRAIEAIVAVLAASALVVVLLNATLVDRRPPSVVRISLSATAQGQAHLAEALTVIDIEFSEPVDRGSVERRFRIAPYVPGTFSWDRDTTLIFTPSALLPAETSFTVSVDPGFADLVGNAAPNAPAPFAFQTAGPPVVLTSLPASGATGVAADSTVALTFDRLMDTGSVEAAITVTPSIPFRSSWAGPIVTLTFGSALAFGTTYTVSIGADASDTGGSHLGTPWSTAFMTVEAGLGVERVIPVDGVAGIGVGSQIAIQFDGPVDPGSIGAALTITPPVAGDLRLVDLPEDSTGPSPSSNPGASPSATPGGTRSGSALVFTPNADLAPHTTYTVVLAPVVTKAGDPGHVSPGRTWAFTTGGPTSSAQNQIAFLSARSGVRNVWLMNPDGSNPRQITTELAPVDEYDVTLDGRTIVYESAGVVTRMRVDGSDTAVMTASRQHEYGPLLSPDGATVLVGRRDASGADLGYWLVPLPGAPAGSGARQVLPDGAPLDGPDSIQGDGLAAGPDASARARRAAFDASGSHLLVVDAQGRVFLVDLLAGGLMASPPPPTPVVVAGVVGAPAWDPIAGSFLLVAGSLGSQTLVGVSPDSGGSTTLFAAAASVAVAGDGGIATLTPDGAHLAYARATSGPSVPLTTAANLVDRGPAFSPAGTTLLFTRALAIVPGRSAGIWLAGLDGRDLRQLSPDGANARWLP